MPDHKEICNRHASQYELLVSREDYQHKNLRTLNQIRPLDGLSAQEFGGWKRSHSCGPGGGPHSESTVH